MKYNKGFVGVGLMMVIIAVLAAGGAGYGYVKYQEKQKVGKATAPIELPEQSNATLPEQNPHVSGTLPANEASQGSNQGQSQNQQSEQSGYAPETLVQGPSIMKAYGISVAVSEKFIARAYEGSRGEKNILIEFKDPISSAISIVHFPNQEQFNKGWNTEAFNFITDSFMIGDVKGSLYEAKEQRDQLLIAIPSKLTTIGISHLLEEKLSQTEYEQVINEIILSIKFDY